MKWIKLWTNEVFYGTTFQELNLEERGVWFSLLVMAALPPRDGIVEMREGVPYQLDFLADLLNCERNLLKKSVKKLEKVKKIRVKEGFIHIKNWKKYQTEYARYRKGLRESKQKNVQKNVHGDMNGCESTTEVEVEVEVDVEGEEERDLKSKKKKEGEPSPKSFRRPKIEEVKAYAKEKGYTFDVEKFFDHWEAVDWYRKPDVRIKNWKNALNIWAKNDAKWKNENDDDGGKFSPY